MKKTFIYLGVLFLFLTGCPQPVVNVSSVNAPEIQGLETGYYTEEQSFTIKTGYGGVAEYSLDGGIVWNDYTGEVTLQPSMRSLLSVVARQYDEKGKVSGNSTSVTVYMDEEPYSAFSVENITAGSFLSSKTIFVLKQDNAVYKYSYDGGNSFTVLPDDHLFLTLEEDGDYNVVIRKENSNGSVISETEPTLIRIMRNAEVNLSPIPGTYADSKNVVLTSPDPTFDVQLQKINGDWTYWENENLSITKEGSFLGDWSDGSPDKLSNNNESFSVRLRDSSGNISPVYSYTYDITEGDLGAPTITGVTSGYFNSDKIITLTHDGDSAEYSLNDGSTWETYTGPFILSNEQSYDLKARNYDQFDQLIGTTATISFTIDKTDPIATITTNVVNNETFVSSQDFVINVLTDDKSQYSSDGTNWNDISGDTYTVDSNGSYTLFFRKVDLAGNTSNVLGAYSFDIDLSPVVVTVVNQELISGNNYNVKDYDNFFTISNTDGLDVSYRVTNDSSTTSWKSFDDSLDYIDLIQDSGTILNELISTFEFRVQDALGDTKNSNMVGIKLNPFIYTVDNSLYASNNTSYFATNPDFTYGEYVIDWGDGSAVGRYTSTSSHTYIDDGIYTIKVYKPIPAIYMQSWGGYYETIVSIDSWGNNQWLSFEGAFLDNKNLTSIPSENPDLSQCTNFERTFRGADLFNDPNISSWDVSNIEDMRNMFFSADSFNQPLNTWDVSNVTDFHGMFENASSFDQPLDSWANYVQGDTVTRIFRNASSFNSSVANWNLENTQSIYGMFDGASSFNHSSITSWKVSGVNHFDSMFKDAISFNQPIGVWDVNAVSDSAYEGLTSMFEGATVFNQDLRSWDVEYITVEPEYFSTGSALTNGNKPIWGTSGL